MSDWQLGRPCENQIGVMKDKHLLFGARFERVGGRCSFALKDEALIRIRQDAGNISARRRAHSSVCSREIR